MSRPQHPFDLSLINLAELKTVFPECSKAVRSSQKGMNTASRHGVKIQVLIKKMKEKLNLDNVGVHELLAKIDHRSQDTITWSEFLKFLDNEGVSREILNDARIYGFGVKRFQGGPRVKLRSKGSMTDHFIECMQFMEFNDNPLALVIFENRTVQLFNLKNFTVLQNVYFPSKYHMPKQYERSRRVSERKDMVMPLSKSIQRRLFKSNRPSTNTSNIVTPTPQPQSVFNLAERAIKEPLKLAKRSSMMQRVRSNQSQQNLSDDMAGSAIMRKMAATASTGKPFGLNADILSSDYERQQSKNEFKRVMDEVESKLIPVNETDPNLSPPYLGMTRQNTHEGPSPLLRSKQTMLPAKKIGIIRRMKPKLSTRGSIFSSLLSQNPRKGTHDNLSVSMVTPGNVAAALDLRDDDSPRRLSEEELFTRSNLNRIKSSKYNSEINQLNKCYVQHSSDSAYHQSMRRYQRPREGEAEWKINPYEAVAAQRSKSTVMGGYTVQGAKELDKIKNKRQMSTNPKELKKVGDEQIIKQKRRKDNEVEINKRIQPVSLAFHSDTGLLVISLIDLETIVYQLKQNGASITLKRLYHFEMPFVASTMDIAFHAINSEQLLLVVGGREGQFAVYHLDYDLDEEETRKRAEKGNEGGGVIQEKPLSETIQSAEIKESSSVNSYAKSQNLSQNRAKRFGKPIYKSIPQTKSAEIVKVSYVKEVGVIVASFNGLLRVLEPMKYRDTLSSSSQKKPALQTITALDYSRKHGLIAMGGVEGKLIMYDTMAEGPCGQVNPGNQILGVYFFDEQLQLIALTMNRQILIYDSNRLECLQSLKDSFHSLIQYRSCCFDVKRQEIAFILRGNLYTACQFVKIWKAKVDPSIELQVLQISANTRTSGSTGTVSQGVKGIESVLVGKFSTLVATFVCERRKQLLTIDSERLVRIFDLKTGKPKNSFNLKINGRLTAAAVDRNDKFIAVGTSVGEVKVFNRSSGGLLYTLASPAEHEQLEITSLQFLNSISQYWLAGTAWKGKVMMWTAPNPTTNYHVNTKAFIAHYKDVLCLDSCATYVATGASDNIVTVWNAFSGNFRFALQMPDDHYLTPSVVSVKFVTRKENVKGEKAFYLIVVQSNGEVHVIDPSAGNICALFVTHIGENPRVDIDKENQRMLAVDQQGKASLIELFSGYGMTQRASKSSKQWNVERVWQAHQITQAEHFTVGVKATNQYSFWLTCTTSGEISLWSYEGDPISTLCSQWDYQSICMKLFNECHVSPRSQESEYEDLEDFDEDDQDEQDEMKKTKKISIMSGSLLAEHELEQQNFQFFKEFLREGSPVKNKSKQINNSMISSSHVLNTTAAPTDMFASFKRKSPNF